MQALEGRVPTFSREVANRNVGAELASARVGGEYDLPRVDQVILGQTAWRTELPRNWGTTQLKHIAQIRYGLSQPPREDAGGVPFIRATDVSRGRINTETVKHVDPADVPLSRDGRLRAGDIIVVRSGAYTGDSAIVPAGLADSVIGYDMVVSPRQTLVEPRYVAWCLLSREALHAQIYLCRARAAQPHLNAEELGSTVLPFPSLPIQRTIATFLDRETAKLDALIETKQRLIELLQEKRTALITQAVTQGLDPSVEMKDSGVEWLGEIPAHWDVVLLKHVAGLQLGITLGKEHQEENLVTRPYLRVANVQTGYLDLEEVTEIQVPRAIVNRYELQPGDVLMTEGGDFDKLGRGCVWEGQVRGCLHQNHIFAVRPRRANLRPKFLAAVLESGYGRAYFTATAKQSTNLASTNSTKVRNFPLPLPHVEDQDEILEGLRRELSELADLTGKIELASARLAEYRTALISAAVTGKIDVREAA